MAIIYLTKNDNSIPTDFTITDQTGAAVDLSNTSNNLFKMALPGSLIDAVNSSTTIQSATGGVLRYVFTSSDLVNAGVFNAELEILYKAGNSSGRIITVGGITVNVMGEEPQ